MQWDGLWQPKEQCKAQRHGSERHDLATIVSLGKFGQYKVDFGRGKTATVFRVLHAVAGSTCIHALPNY